MKQDKSREHYYYSNFTLLMFRESLFSFQGSRNICSINLFLVQGILKILKLIPFLDDFMKYVDFFDPGYVHLSVHINRRHLDLGLFSVVCFSRNFFVKREIECI